MTDQETAFLVIMEDIWHYEGSDYEVLINDTFHLTAEENFALDKFFRRDMNHPEGYPVVQKILDLMKTDPAQCVLPWIQEYSKRTQTKIANNKIIRERAEKEIETRNATLALLNGVIQ